MMIFRPDPLFHFALHIVIRKQVVLEFCIFRIAVILNYKIELLPLLCYVEHKRTVIIGYAMSMVNNFGFYFSRSLEEIIDRVFVLAEQNSFNIV